MQNNVQRLDSRPDQEEQNYTFRLPSNFTNQIQLTGIDDPRLPKQIAKGLAARQDVLEKTHFRKGEENTG